MQKSEFIDYARGFSILTIVVYHLSQGLAMSLPFKYAFSFGGAGVHLFFFASGFGLAKSKYTTYFDFLKRRLNKVLIPYYITVTLIFLINIFIKIYPFGVPAYLSHIFLYKMFIPKYDESFGGQLWFISTIIQFYLVFPLILWLLNKEKYKVFFGTALIISLAYSLAVALSPYADLRVFNGFFLQYLWEFALGMIVARTNTLDKIIGMPIWRYFLIALICIPVAMLMVLNGGAVGKSMNDLFVFAAYTSVVIILYRLAPVSKLILWITGFSYALYLTHLFIFSCFYTPETRAALGGFTLPVVFSGMILFAWAYNWLIIQVTSRKTVRSSITHEDKTR